MNSDAPPTTLRLAILLDANIWHADPLLKGPDGAALLHYLHEQQNFLALPEVVAREIEKHLHIKAEESAEMITEGWRFLERITGKRPEFRPPGKEERQSALAHRLDELSALILRVPLRVEHARAALDRVNECTPLNGPKNQQYKDSLIWEAALELAATYRVKLVTADKGFYENHDPKKGLAKNLLDEASRTNGVEAYFDIKECLESLGNYRDEFALSCHHVPELRCRSFRDPRTKDISSKGMLNVQTGQVCQ